MVATPNSVFTNFIFWFVVPSRFWLRQMATPLGTLESQTIYLDVQDWCGFSSYFFFSHYFFGYAFFIFFYKIIVCVYSIFFIFVFGIIARCGFRYALYSPFTHTFYSLHEWGPIPRSELLRIRGDCVAMSQWMYFPSGHCENPS